MSTATTSKGTALPMIKLKGKDYLLIAHRLLWLNDDFENFTIDTQVLQLTEEYAVVRSDVRLLDKNGTVIRSATATKRETKSDFADFLEKAETGSVGRALAMIGIGTQFAQQDMEEGMRLADAPLDPPSKKNSTKESRAAFRAAAAKEVEPVLVDVKETSSAVAEQLSQTTIAGKSTSGSFRRDRQTTTQSKEPFEQVLNDRDVTAPQSKGGWR